MQERRAGIGGVGRCEGGGGLRDSLKMPIACVGW
jgi:hypothetical protein